jgi:hypothetical protein
LLRSASEVLSNYRALLNAKKIVPEELSKVTGDARPKTAPTKNAPTSKMKRPLSESK